MQEGWKTQALNLDTAAGDTGPMSLSFAAGVPISVTVAPPNKCKGNTNNLQANVVGQYKAQ